MGGAEGGEGGDLREVVAVGFCEGGDMLASHFFLLYLFILWTGEQRGLTFELCDVHAKGVALFEHAFAAALDEVVEALGELGHAFAQVVEAEVDGWEVVGHGGRVGVESCGWA